MIFLADVKFILSPKSTVGIVGDVVKLSCEARGQSVKAIEWTVGDNKVSSSGLVYGFSSRETANGRRSTLTIKQLKLSDGSLQYFCTAGTTMSPGLLVSSAATIHGVLSAQHILCSLFFVLVHCLVSSSGYDHWFQGQGLQSWRNVARTIQLSVYCQANAKCCPAA